MASFTDKLTKQEQQRQAAKSTYNRFYVGPVEREGRRVCACCKLSVQFCLCKHDNRYDDLNCDRRI